MNDAKSATRRLSLLGVVLGLLVMPACQGARPWSRDPAASRRVAYRPVQTSLRGRPFYVSGYGGTDYSPARPRKADLLPAVPGYVVPAPAAGAPAVSVRQGTWDEP